MGVESRRTGKNDRRNENEQIPETHLQEQRVNSQETISRQNEPNVTNEDVQEHVISRLPKKRSNVLNEIQILKMKLKGSHTLMQTRKYCNKSDSQ